MSTVKYCDSCGCDITNHSQVSSVNLNIEQFQKPPIKKEYDVCKGCSEKISGVLVLTFDELFKHNTIQKSNL